MTLFILETSGCHAYTRATAASYKLGSYRDTDGTSSALPQYVLFPFSSDPHLKNPMRGSGQK